MSVKRFDIDDRVCCRTGTTSWERGTIVALDYREEGWRAGLVAPYQIALDDGRLIYAPADNEQLIKSEAQFDEMLSRVGAHETQQLLYDGNDESDEQHTVPRDHREFVESHYPRKHPKLFDPSELPALLDPQFAAALSQGSEALRALWTEEARGLYAVRIFSDAFCQQLLEECEHFEAWCIANGVAVHRPNTMNNYGAIVDDFGMAPMMRAIMCDVVAPLSLCAGYSDVLGDGSRGSGDGAEAQEGAESSRSGGDSECPFGSHHAFLVSYALGKDRDLGFHVDSSDVTLNVCLGRTFEGGKSSSLSPSHPEVDLLTHTLSSSSLPIQVDFSSVACAVRCTSRAAPNPKKRSSTHTHLALQSCTAATIAMVHAN